MRAPRTGGPVLAEGEWRAREEAHVRRLERWTEPRRRRRARGQRHPVHDFLFDYYRYSTAKLLEWHPPIGASIEDSEEARTRFRPPVYRRGAIGLWRNPESLKPKECERLRWTRDLLRRTASRPAWLECFGIHEWAMLYRAAPARHEGALGLRVDQETIDRFVDSRGIVCTHFDAYRFFSDDAKPINRARPSLDTRQDMEQPGCVHANMDLYKWAYRSMPWIGSDLLADCFELAVELRELDMRASPYDLSRIGFARVPVETDMGRREYVDLQRRLARRAAPLRSRLIDALGYLLGASTPQSGRAEQGTTARGRVTHLAVVDSLSPPGPLPSERVGR